MTPEMAERAVCELLTMQLAPKERELYSPTEIQISGRIAILLRQSGVKVAFTFPRCFLDRIGIAIFDHPYVVIVDNAAARRVYPSYFDKFGPPSSTYMLRLARTSAMDRLFEEVKLKEKYSDDVLYQFVRATGGVLRILPVEK